MAAEEAQLLERIRRKAHRKRPLWTSELIVRPGYALSFIMIGIIKASAKPTPKKVSTLVSCLRLPSRLLRRASARLEEEELLLKPPLSPARSP